MAAVWVEIMRRVRARKRPLSGPLSGPGRLEVARACWDA